MLSRFLLTMADRGGDVISLCCLDQEGLALSDISGVVITQKSSKDKTKKGDAVTPKSSGKVKPYASKKGQK